MGLRARHASYVDEQPRSHTSRGVLAETTGSNVNEGHLKAQRRVPAPRHKQLTDCTPTGHLERAPFTIDSDGTEVLHLPGGSAEPLLDAAADQAEEESDPAR